MIPLIRGRNCDSTSGMVLGHQESRRICSGVRSKSGLFYGILATQVRSIEIAYIAYVTATKLIAVLR